MDPLVLTSSPSSPVVALSVAYAPLAGTIAGAAQRCVVCASNRTPTTVCDHGFALVLGEGTYGQVFLCRMLDGSSFVEKVLKVDASVTHQREIQNLAQCRHPNIVRLISASSSPVNGRVTVRMEHCEGGDLFHRIQQQRMAGCLLPPAAVMSFVTQLLLATHYLHSRSILHRDIKTNNLFLNRDGSVLKLGDFGCSYKSDISIAEDQRRTLCGTWHSAAPELLAFDSEQKAQYGKKAETWSIGVVMYEMMTLVPPFTCDVNDAASFHAMLRNIIAGVYDPIPLTHGYPQEMVSLCASMLIVSRSDRPSVRTLLQSPLCQAAARDWVQSCSALSEEERNQVFEQLRSVQEPTQSCGFQGPCFRVRSSTSEIIPAELRITEGGQLMFRDTNRSKVAEWSVCSLIDCQIGHDDFEEGDGKQFYGLCFRPKKLNPVTLGYFVREERDQLADYVQRFMSGD